MRLDEVPGEPVSSSVSRSAAATGPSSLSSMLAARKGDLARMTAAGASVRWVSSTAQFRLARDDRHQHRGGLGITRWRNDARASGLRSSSLRRGTSGGAGKSRPRARSRNSSLVEAEIVTMSRPISAAGCIGKKRPDDQTPNQPSSTVPRADQVVEQRPRDKRLEPGPHQHIGLQSTGARLVLETQADARHRRSPSSSTLVSKRMMLVPALALHRHANRREGRVVDRGCRISPPA